MDAVVFATASGVELDANPCAVGASHRANKEDKCCISLGLNKNAVTHARLGGHRL
jgi:hypothetical protein